METRWRPFIESIPAYDEKDDAEPGVAKARKRRSAVADGLRA